MNRWRILFCTGLLLTLTACGFHLRRGAQLPPGMQRIHLDVRGGGDLPRELAHTLVASGATLVDQSGPGVAEFVVPVARFSTAALTFTGHARVGEYQVRYHVQFKVTDAKGKPLVPLQKISLSREYTYDARQPVGSSTQTEEIRASLVRQMVQAIEFRLRAASEHPPTGAVGGSVPAVAGSTAAGQ
jgi:LPS-assembly lipoprotein